MYVVVVAPDATILTECEGETNAVSIPPTHEKSLNVPPLAVDDAKSAEAIVAETVIVSGLEELIVPDGDVESMLVTVGAGPTKLGLFESS